MLEAHIHEQHSATHDGTAVAKLDEFLIKQFRECLYKPTILHAHDTQTRNNNLRITQRVAPCGNRTRYTAASIALPSHRANHAVKLNLTIEEEKEKKMM
uniref:SFRICE_017235 n=1 Tax=Spodoptera frugiperda TaxID=7108 RepID=A0A2H1VZA9_SPOFR